MVCNNCGKEIENGKMYCSYCGTEARLIPDYNELEEELLRIVADEPKEDKSEDKPSDNDGDFDLTDSSSKDQRNIDKDKKSLISLKGKIILIILLLTTIGIVVYSVSMVNKTLEERNANSFDYQYNLATEYYEAGDYENSLLYYQNAEKLNPDDFELKITIAHNYLSLGDAKSYRLKMDEIIAMNVNNAYVYQDLITFYDSQHMYEEIIDLCNDLNDPSLLYMFEDYMVPKPTFSSLGGNFNHKFDLNMSAVDAKEILYTLDGSDPRENGQPYGLSITIDEGTTVVRAVAVNKKGVFSDECKAEFVVIPEPIKAPTSSLPSGEYQSGTEILLQAESGSKVYYTWNGSVPNENSAEYTTPLQVPVGDNILTIIAISSYGDRSPVAQYHYVNQVPQ